MIGKNKLKGVTMKRLYVGADASKGYCDFIILDENLKVIEEHFQLYDLYKGHKVLSKIIKNLFRTHKQLRVYFGIESTGGYENNWFSLIWELKDEYNIKLIRLNPKNVYHQKKASQNKITTDKESAKSIAEYVKLHENKLRFNQDQQYTDLRKLWSHLKMSKKQFCQSTNQLEKYLYSANPEILSYCKHNESEWLYKVLRRYPTATKLSRARIKTLCKIPYVTEQKARELVNRAKNSVASFTSELAERLIVRVVDEIILLRKVIKEMEEEIIIICDIPEINLLKSFTGISDVSGCGLMLEIERIQRFKSAKKLASYFGVHPVFKESGDGVSSPKMSKEGRSEGRRILFNVVKSAIVHNKWIKQLYEEYQKKGKSKLSAIGILMHKTLRIIYGMLKNKTKYNPDIDKSNRKRFFKIKRENNNKKLNKTRRFQSENDNAPISRKQYKKRKEQNAASPNDFDH